jgi:hypothetical protein
MYKLTSKLIAGSPVSPGSHPILISLLELAAQPPGIDKNGFPDATSWESFRKRVQRDWGDIAAAFKAAVLAGITDAAVVAACPHEGLTFSAEAGWELKPFEHNSYRKRVASLIKKAGDVESGESRLEAAELAALVKAFDKAIRAELALKLALRFVGYAVYAAGVDLHVKALQRTRRDIKADNT